VLLTEELEVVGEALLLDACEGDPVGVPDAAGTVASELTDDVDGRGSLLEARSSLPSC